MERQTASHRLAHLVRFVVFSVGVAACSAAAADDDVTNDDDLTGQAAYQYACRATTSRTVLDTETFTLTVADGHLRFDGGHGTVTGARDRAYRSPKNTSRARYSGFDWGDDCTFKLVVDATALAGKGGVTLRAQCSTEDEFRQDIFACGSPKKTRLDVKPAPATPVAEPILPASAKQWICRATSESGFGPQLGLQVTEKAIRIKGEFDWEGSRDAGYKSKSGATIAFDGFDYGGDCELSAIVDAKILSAGTTSAALKVRCRGESFEQYAYTCKP